ncbi:disease resistance protein RUN1 isoform X1 [Cryptomeria japonica]|uniref:disease resistance protein RUN1 isoform X1 n=1 Tax=Cryptomeria japonica TaxID=3369 RepID=UPI0027DA956C|nr:disease resistance protein RUN1 isoform X1 [Cryptomeria japonica]XP_059066960.1 disease resistance protein RUN1 isoform X1 [Cryptomeria japonica]
MKSKSVKVVVIYGQGGMGKTTLATAVFSNLDLKNYKYCRIDIEQNCSEADLKLLQQQILRDLYDQNIELRNLNEGREKLSKDFKEHFSKPIFIFVDNALKQSDLEKLLPITDLASLPAQSRILVTTRNLNETRIILEEGVERHSYRVAYLPQEEARKLLCELALGNAQASFDPIVDIEGLLKICQGIPLVLKLVGVRLREHAQSVSACRDVVESLKSELLQGEGDELRERMVDFVYNRLKTSCKEAFLDIVFFFCNWERDQVTYSVGEIEFEELERAALVNVTNEGKVNVHDIVKARGRMLSADGERITDLQSLNDVLQNVERIKKTKGIVLSPWKSFELEANHLSLMKRCLRVLILAERTRIVNGECKGAFENLRLLSLNNHNNYSQMDVSKHPRLAVFLLDYKLYYPTFPEFAGTIPSSLRYMYIKHATLVNITTIISQSQSLRSLTLSYCTGFDSLPKTFGNLTTLEKLSLESCNSLVNLPNSFGNLSCLKKLSIKYCSSLMSLPKSVGKLSSLNKLDLQSCSSLLSLLDSVGNLSSLNILSLRYCSRLVSLSDSVGNLSSLKKLDLYGCSSLASLPDSFGNLTSFSELDLYDCSSLVSLPNSVGNLSSLEILSLRYCSRLMSLSDSVGNLSSLKKLDLYNCSSLTSLPDSFGSLTSFCELDLSYCSSLVSLPNSVGNLSSLEILSLRYSSKLVSLPDSVGNLSSFKKLDLYKCSSSASLPDSFGNLTSFSELDLYDCSSLVSLPNSAGNLSSLEILSLRYCSRLVSLSDSVGNLSSLKKLDLYECSSLVSLPNSMDNLFSLNELDLYDCSSLVSLPDTFGNLYGLVKLYLTGYRQLSMLPESFGNLASLEKLIFRNCKKLQNLPQNFGQLKCLKYVSIHECIALQSLSGDFESLSSLIAVKASECPQLEETAMDKLAKMKGLMMVDIDGSPMLEKRWEQVKEQYSLAVVECGRKEFTDEIYPCVDVMYRAFFHSESKFVYVDENGQLVESPSPAGGIMLWFLLKECDVRSSSSSPNSSCWEAVKKEWMELAASKGGQMIYVDMGRSWEEREKRVQQALLHLPRGTLAWIAPDNRARLSFAYSVQSYYEDAFSGTQSEYEEYVKYMDPYPPNSIRLGTRGWYGEPDLGIENCIVSTFTFVHREGRRRFDAPRFILPDLHPLQELSLKAFLTKYSPLLQKQ